MSRYKPGNSVSSPIYDGVLVIPQKIKLVACKLVANCGDFRWNERKIKESNGYLITYLLTINYKSVILKLDLCIVGLTDL